MTLNVILKYLITFTALLMALSALGFLLFPSIMLGIVGIGSNPQTDFLLRTAGVGVAALTPGVWASRTWATSTPAATSPVARATLVGLVGYLFLSSVVDFYAYTQAIVNAVSLPSIAFRIVLGTVTLWLVWKATPKG